MYPMADIFLNLQFWPHPKNPSWKLKKTILEEIRDFNANNIGQPDIGVETLSRNWKHLLERYWADVGQTSSRHWANNGQTLGSYWADIGGLQNSHLA